MLSASLLVEIFDFRFLIALKMGVADFKFDFFTGILPPFYQIVKVWVASSKQDITFFSKLVFCTSIG